MYWRYSLMGHDAVEGRFTTALCSIGAFDKPAES